MNFLKAHYVLKFFVRCNKVEDFHGYRLQSNDFMFLTNFFKLVPHFFVQLTVSLCSLEKNAK